MDLKFFTNNNNRIRNDRIMTFKLPKKYGKNKVIKTYLPENEYDLHDWVKSMVNGYSGYYFKISAFMDEELINLLTSWCQSCNSSTNNSDEETDVIFNFPFGKYYADRVTLVRHDQITPLKDLIYRHSHIKVDELSIINNLSKNNKTNYYFKGPISCNGIMRKIK